MSTKRPSEAVDDDDVAVSEGAPGESGSDDIVRLHRVGVRYQLRRGLLSRRKEYIMAVDDVTLSVAKGETLGLVGTTGSGKSTIAHVIMGMVAPTTGSVLIRGRGLYGDGNHETATPAEAVQVVLQDPYSSLDPRMKVGDIIAEPIMRVQQEKRRPTRAEVGRLVEELLDRVGLPVESADQYPQQFSGGQRQRIAIARALGPKPELIILDEPTSALDVSVRAQILELLKSLQRQLGLTYLIISHDLVTVLYLASTVAVMHRGRVVESGPATTVCRSPHHPYTLELLASVPGASGEFLNQEQPAPESDLLQDAACRYASGCLLRARLGNPVSCVEDFPALAEVGQSHVAACHFPDEARDLARTIDRLSDS